MGPRHRKRRAYGPESSSFVDYCEFQSPALLIHGKPGLHPELERLHLQAGPQTPIDGKPVVCCCLSVSFLDSRLIEWFLLR